MILAFDLDDTLFPEITYVFSGFNAVARYLHNVYGISTVGSVAFMQKVLNDQGRGHVFDETLMHYGIFSKRLVNECIRVYRMHKPEISLSREANECLERFRKYPIYIVTDGNKVVQGNKLDVLGLCNRVKKCFITHRYGIKYAKPSPYCFTKICERENAKPEDIVYIADNPIKDFVGIKPLGFRTIRILQGPYKDVVKPLELEADYRIDSLSELTDDFLKQVFMVDRNTVR